MVAVSSSDSITRPNVNLKTADGELRYCIRYLNSEQRFLGRIEPASDTVRYTLEQQDTDLIGAGDTGSILLWSIGDQTYLERTSSPQSTESEALAHILAQCVLATI
jgi:hypothetical protein